MSLINTLFKPINDITTDFGSVPQYVPEKAYNPKFRVIQEKLYPDLRPLSSDYPAAAFFEKVLELAKTHWKIVSVEQKKCWFQAEARTPTLGFVDDLVAEVRPATKGSVLHMRSRSRLGRNDFGANYNRIKRFFELVDGSNVI